MLENSLVCVVNPNNHQETSLNTFGGFLEILHVRGLPLKVNEFPWGVKIITSTPGTILEFDLYPVH